MKRKVFFLIAAVLLATAMSSCDLIFGLFTAKGTVTGYVYSATTDDVLSGVVVEVDSTGKTATTNSSGYFEIEAPEGSQVLHFTKSGYTFYDVSVLVVADDEVGLWEDVVGYEPLVSGEVRIVLTWGALPEDLDSHLYTPGTEEIFYNNPASADGDESLDWDDTDGYGPETITITDKEVGTYYYSVYDYYETGDLGSSGAVVKVYNSSGLWKTYNISAASGDGTKAWWRVFSLNGGTITAIGTFSDTAGDTWAGDEW